MKKSSSSESQGLIEKSWATYFKKSLNEVYTLPLSKIAPDDKKNKLKRLQELHPSSFPYCQLKHYASNIALGDNPEDVMTVDQTFMTDYILGNGTLIHNALQKYLGMGGQLIGNWECLKCGKWKKACVYKECKSCVPGCQVYHELGGKYRKSTYWHSDGVFKVTIKGKDYHIIIDYKSTSSYKLYRHRSSPQFPAMYNVWQIKHYAPLIEEKYGIKIDGYALIYVSRDFPNSYTPVFKMFSSKEKSKITKRMEGWDKQFTKIKTVNEYDKETVKKCISNKLCKDRAYYDKFVANPYNECPVVDVCFSGDKHVIKFFKKLKDQKDEE